jgi:hypothetical protein
MLKMGVSRRLLGVFLCVSAAACGGHGTSDLVPTPDPAPALSPQVDARAALRASGLPR